MKEIRNILLADDDKNDQFFVKRAFNLLSSAVNVQMVSTGAEAMQYISGCGQFADRDRYPFPELVLTDWKMPSHLASLHPEGITIPQAQGCAQSATLG